MTRYDKQWYRLALDSSMAIRRGFSWPEIPKGAKRAEFFKADPREVLEDSWLEIFKAANTEITSVILFWRDGNSDHGWTHIDINAQRQRTISAINWAFEDGSPVMKWYEEPPSDDVNAAKTYVSPGNGYSLAFPASSLREIDSCHIGMLPTLVRTDIPHQVLVGQSTRWCVSARFRGRRYQSWDQVVTHFFSAGLLQAT